MKDEIEQTTIELKDTEAAIIFRDGQKLELVIPSKNPDEMVSENGTVAFALAAAMENSELSDAIMANADKLFEAELGPEKDRVIN